MSEWAFNEADIDRSKIVWAHDMGPEQNSAISKTGRCGWWNRMWLPEFVAWFPWSLVNGCDTRERRKR